MRFHCSKEPFFIIFNFLLTDRDFQLSITNLLADIEAERVKHSTKLNKKPNKTEKHFEGQPILSGDTYKKSCLLQKKICPDYIQQKPKMVLSCLSSLFNSNNTDSTNLSCFGTNSSVSTFKTYDNIEFQNELIHLETKIDVVKDALNVQKNFRIN